jgi:hypothetical protein
MKYILKDRKIIENCIEDVSGSLGMEVIIQKPKRSNPQNNLYWSLVKVLSDYIGDTQETIHERLKVEFLGIERKIVRGIELIMPKSTAELNTKEFTEYIDKVYLLGETLELKMPKPSDYGYGEKND